MKGSRYLVLKGRTWWFHRAIPKSIQAAFGGKKTLTVNLETSDYRVAQNRRDAAFADSERQFHAARTNPTQLSPRERITEWGLSWAAELRSYHADPFAWAAKALGENVEDLEVEELISPDMILDEEAERIEREHGRQERNRFLSLVHGAAPIDQHLEAHLSECGLSARAIQERRTAVRRVLDWAPELTLSTLNRAKAGRYISEVLATGHPKTANKAISNIRRYWTWLEARGHVADNPWRGQHVDGRRVSKNTEPERAFTNAEMHLLLTSDWPVGMRPGGETTLRDAMRIAALSGMRIEEICQLTVSDCRDNAFNIRRSKTKAGIRRVPIHSGLEEIVCRRSASKRGQEYLLDELRRDADRERSAPLSKRFTRYRKAVGIDERQEGQRRSLVNFHSFRRWFITEAERAGQPPHIIEAVVGHRRQGMSLGVYSGGPSVHDQMRTCVEAVLLPCTRQD